MAQGSLRNYEANASVSHWQGSPTRLVRIARRAAELMARQEGKSLSDVNLSFTITYGDGSERFKGLAAVVGADLAVSRVVGFNITALSEDWSQKIAVAGSDTYGVVARVESPDEAFALGARDVINAQIEENRIPVYRERRRPLRWYEWLALVLVAAVGVAMSVWFLSTGSTDTFSTLYFALILAMLGWGPVMFLGDRRVENDHLALVSVEGPTPEKAEPGLVLRAQAWIKSHPLVNLALGFTLGVLTNVVADGIKRL